MSAPGMPSVPLDRPLHFSERALALAQFLLALDAIDLCAEPFWRVSEFQSSGSDFCDADYVTASGWRFSVFPDGSLFDYVTSFTPPGGESIRPEWPSSRLIGNPYADAPERVERAMWRLLIAYSPRNEPLWEAVTYGANPYGPVPERRVP